MSYVTGQEVYVSGGDTGLKVTESRGGRSYWSSQSDDTGKVTG